MPTSSNRTSEFVCTLTDEVAALFHSESCAKERIREADESTCLLYKTLSYQNSVIGCFGRECEEFNTILVAYLVAFGGLAGGILLLILSGFTCQPSSRKKMEDELFDPEAAEDSIEELVESVDLTDGIDNGEEGVIAAFIVMYFCKEGEEYVAEKLRRVAYIFVWFRFLKKLGLKLILAVPLLIAKNYVSSAFFIIDVFIFFRFAIKQKYFPSSLYNEVHVLITGRKFRKVIHYLSSN